MSRADDRALFFCPTKRVEAESWPVIFGRASWVHLIGESEEDEMAGLVGAEAGDFDIIAEQVGVL